MKTKIQIFDLNFRNWKNYPSYDKAKIASMFLRVDALRKSFFTLSSRSCWGQYICAEGTRPSLKTWFYKGWLYRQLSTRCAPARLLVRTRGQGLGSLPAWSPTERGWGCSSGTPGNFSALGETVKTRHSWRKELLVLVTGQRQGGWKASWGGAAGGAREEGQ